MTYFWRTTLWRLSSPKWLPKRHNKHDGWVDKGVSIHTQMPAGLGKHQEPNVKKMRGEDWKVIDNSVGAIPTSTSDKVLLNGAGDPRHAVM